MRCARELVVGVAHPEVLIKAEIDQAIVASPAVGVEYGFRPDSAADDRLESGFGGIRHDLGIDLIASFQKPEDDRLAAGSAASLATHTTRAKVRFVGLNLAQEGRSALTRLSHPGAHFQKDAFVERIEMPVTAAVCVAVRSSTKTVNETPKSRLTDLGTPKILVNPNHHRRLALSSKSFAS